MLPRELQRLLSHVLLGLLILQPCVFAIRSERVAREMDRMAREMNRAAREMERIVAEEHEKGATDLKAWYNSREPGERIHVQVTGRDGKVTEKVMERSIEHLGSKGGVPLAQEGSFGIVEQQGFQEPHQSSRERNAAVKEVPQPRQLELGARGTQGYDADRRAMQDFRASVERAEREHTEEDRNARHELEYETKIVESVAADGARLGKEWSDRVAAAQRSIDEGLQGFDPPAVETIVFPGLEFQGQELAALVFDEALRRMDNSLEAVGSKPSLIAPTAVERSWLTASIEELRAALGEDHRRIGAFLNAHRDTLRAGAEIAIDLALGAFPMTSLAWGAANLAAMAASGETLMGLKVEGPADFLLVAVGAILPSVPAKTFRKFRELLPRMSDEAAVLASGNANLERYLDQVVASSAIPGSRYAGYNGTDWLRVAKSYQALESKVATIKSTTFRGKVTRAVEAEVRDKKTGAVIKLNTEADVFGLHPGMKTAGGRYAIEGSAAIYTAVGEGPGTWRVVMEELAERADKPIVVASKELDLTRVLDLTDSEVLSHLGVSPAALVADSDDFVRAYEITHQIGDIARRHGFEALKAKSAAVGGADNVILLEGK